MARVESGVAFATHDGVTLRGDLYAPQHGAAHPIVVAVSGGGWLRGDKTDLAHWGGRLADAGIAVFSVDYRRSTSGAIFPKNAQDVFAAAQFVHANASALGVDSKGIGLLGASAGAHLAALAALAGASPALTGQAGGGIASTALPFIRALVGVYGIYDLPEHWKACQSSDAEPRDDMADRMMGASLPEAPDTYRDASPASYVEAAEPTPKVLLIWGEADKVVSPAQSQSFASALSAARRPAETIAVPGAGHFWFSKEKDTFSGYNGEIALRLITFLERALSA